jgi:hypothetical protein
MRVAIWVGILCAGAALAQAADGAAPGGRVIQVGAARSITRPSQAAAIAESGDVIELDPEVYAGDVAVWTVNDIVIRGMPDQDHRRYARMLAHGAVAEGKAIWVIKGNNVKVENIEFAEAAAPAGNGAGIRAEGDNLVVSGCYFHDNEEGILTTVDLPDSVIDIEGSEFARDGGNGGQSHEIYINHVHQLIVRGSYFHDGRIGHLIKSRAQQAVIEANRITDEEGSASYEIEFPNGGFDIVRGNIIEKGPNAQNNILLAFGFEGAVNPVNQLYVVNNTFLNRRGRGTFVAVAPPARATLVNNIFLGAGEVFSGKGAVDNNLLAAGPGGGATIPMLHVQDGVTAGANRTAQNAGLRDPAAFDFRPAAGSPAIGLGRDPGAAGGVTLLQAYAYVQGGRARPVAVKPPIDAGAFQSGG